MLFVFFMNFLVRILICTLVYVVFLMRFPLLTFCGSWSTARRYSLAWRKGWGLFDCTFRHPPLFYRFTRRFGGGKEEVGLTVNVTGGLIGGFWQEAQI